MSRGIYSQSVNQTTPYLTTDQLFPSFSEQGVATPAANTFLAVSMSPEPRNPYVDQWSLGVQRQLTKNTVAELNYVGSKGNNLLMRINIAQALEYTPDNPTVAGRKPFPNFGVYIDSTWSGTSKYNALNAKLEHHGRDASRHLRLHLLEEHRQQVGGRRHRRLGLQRLAGIPRQPQPGPRLRPLRLRRGPSRRRQLRVEPALRQGRALRRPALRLRANAIIGGWQVNGIYIWQHGFPITDPGRRPRGTSSTASARTGPTSPAIPTRAGERIEQWFNTGAFTQPALGQFGNSTRNMLRAPTINNLDFALFKNFNLPRGSRLQFRFESFNAFNHPNFTGVSTNITDPAFGRLTSARPGRINQLGLKLIW